MKQSGKSDIAQCGTLRAPNLVSFFELLEMIPTAKIGGGQNRSKAEIAQLTAFKYLGNARATGGPGILPET